MSDRRKTTRGSHSCLNTCYQEGNLPGIATDDVIENSIDCRHALLGAAVGHFERLQIGVGAKLRLKD